MMYLPKKIILSFCTFIFLLIAASLFLPTSTSAAETIPTLAPTTSPSDVFRFSIPKMIESEKNAQKKEAQTGQTVFFADRLIDYQLNLIMGKIICMIFLCDPQSNQPTALGTLAQAIGTIYQYPPASGIAYGYDLLQNAGLVKPAFAQGIGFAGLLPLLPVWKIARNISYTILIIVMVVIGFMIIFRMKIDPKTVISLQAALPKIIITLLLITFSYAIAGFMIDLMYLVMAIVIQLMASAVPPDLPAGAEFLRDVAQQQAEFMAPGNIGKLFTAVFSLGMIPAFLQQTFLGSIPTIEITAGIFGIITLLLKVFAGLVLWQAVGVAGGILVGILILIIALGLLFTFIRLFMLLLNSYIHLLLTVMFGPILLLQEAIPGQSAFAQWMQNLIANLIVFPATVGVIYLSWIFTTVAWSKNLWSAPLIPSGGGGDIASGNPLAIFIGLGIIFMAPNLVAQVKKAFHPKPALPVTAGSAFAPVTGAVGSGMGALQSFYYFKMTAGGIPVIGRYLGGEPHQR